MYEESGRDDFLKFKKNEKVIIKRDIWLYISILGIIVSFMLMLFIPYLVIALVFFIMLTIWRCQLRIYAKREVILKDYEAYIIKTTPQGYEPNSAIYHSYIKLDNKERMFSFYFDDKEYISISYDDIISYEILIDKKIFPYKRLPEKPDPRVRSYILLINCKSGHKVEIGYSNMNKYIKLRKGYVYQQFANTISINKIAVALDRVLRKR